MGASAGIGLVAGAGRSAGVSQAIRAPMRLAAASDQARTAPMGPASAASERLRNVLAEDPPERPFDRDAELVLIGFSAKHA